MYLRRHSRIAQKNGKENRYTEKKIQFDFTPFKREPDSGRKEKEK